MYELFLKYITYIFPPSEESRIVDALCEKDIARFFQQRQFEHIYVLSRYADPHIRALIHEAKFHTNERAWKLLHILLTLYLQQNTQKIDCIIPIPLSPARMRARGYNQVHKIVTANTPLPFPTHTNILERHRNTRPQTELRRSERLTNMQNAFCVKKGSEITNKHILIIDDVATTGATLHAAKEALLPYQPTSVTLVALAH